MSDMDCAVGGWPEFTHQFRVDKEQEKGTYLARWSC